MRFAAVIEKTGNEYSAHVPDLPGCAAAGDTRAETEALIREAVVEHLELLRESGDPIPEPQASTSLVEVYEVTTAHRDVGEVFYPREQQAWGADSQSLAVSCLLSVVNASHEVAPAVG